MKKCRDCRWCTHAGMLCVLFVNFLAVNIHAAETNAEARIAVWRAAGIEDTWGIWSGARYRRFGDQVIDLLPYAAPHYDQAALRADFAQMDASSSSLAKKIGAIRNGSMGAGPKRKSLAEQSAALRAQRDALRAREESLLSAQRDSCVFMLDAKVTQVVPDGLLLDSALLAGYPEAVVDGAGIHCIVLKQGSYSFSTVLNARRTVDRLIYGVPIRPEK